jgi:hypothetical protein
MPDDDDQELETGETPEDHLKALRAKAKAKDKTDAENANLRKELAFRDAKVDLSNPVGKLLIESWSGDPNVADITAKATELGCLLADAAPPPPPPAAVDAGSSDERAAFASGAHAETGEVQSMHPHQEAMKAFQDGVSGGDSDEKALAKAIHIVATAAANGDTRALWQPGNS